MVRRESRFLDGVDVVLHQVGDLEVVVDHVVGDGVHHRIRTQSHLFWVGLHPLAHFGESAVLTVSDRDDERCADEDRDLARLDNLPGQHDRIVRHILDRLEHQEEQLVVTLQLGPLVCTHRVLDGQWMQSENLGQIVHLALVGLVQPNPDEGVLADLLQLAHLGASFDMGVRTG